MRYFTIMIVATFACSAGTGQNPIVTPKGLKDIACTGPHHSLGNYKDSRHMLMDGELRGTKATIKEVDFRLSYWNYESWGGGASPRSWTGVRVRISECDIDNKSHVFSKNPTTTPSLVFSAATSWPGQVGFPATRPAPWTIRFPFAKPWVYSGKQDVCLDFDFDGGRFPNGDWHSKVPAIYSLETTWNSTMATGRNLRLGAANSYVGCFDHVNPLGWVATSWFSRVWVYGPDHAFPAKRNKVEIAIGTGGMRGPVVTAIGFAGSLAGTTFHGVTCNKLFVDLSKPTVYLPSVHGRDNRITRFPLIAYRSNYSNVGLWIQSVWNDSQNGAMKLSVGGLSWIPEMPRAVRFEHLHQIDPADKASFGLFGLRPLHPLMRYVR